MESAEIGKIFFDDGYRLADVHIRSILSKETIFQAIRVLYESIDGLLISLCHRSALEGMPVECERGCSWCCHQAVFAVSHEFLYVWEHAIYNLDERLLQRIRQATDNKYSSTKGRSEKELLRLKLPCPFLDRGACTVYTHRPMACRIYLSTSKASCREEFQDPQDEQNIPALLEFPLQAGRMMNEGFVARLREAGLKCGERPLEWGLSEVQNAAPDYIDKWLSGGDLFSKCERQVV
jgi:Fe-S-cluster containining protein